MLKLGLPPSDINELSTSIAKRLPTIKNTLPEYLRSDENAKSFMLSLVRIAEKDNKILSCNLRSILAAFLSSVQLGLQPDTVEQHAHLIPYKGELTLQIGYRGFVHLAYRGGNINSLDADNVYSRDKFECVKGTENILKHSPEFNNRGDYLGTYAIANLISGESVFTLVDKAEVNKAKSKSGMGKGITPAWRDWEDEMRKKVAIKRLIKILPWDKRLVMAADIDNNIESGKSMSLKEEISNEPFDYQSHVEVKENKQEESEKDQKSINNLKKAMKNGEGI